MTGKSALGRSLASSLFNSETLTWKTCYWHQRLRGELRQQVFASHVFFFFYLLIKVGEKDKLKAIMSVLCAPNFKHSNVGDSTVQRSVFPITKQSTSESHKACVALYLPNNQTWEINKELFVMTLANEHNVIINLKQ